MFSCNLCSDWVSFSYYCKECSDIRRVLLLCGKKEVHKSVMKTFVNDSEKYKNLIFQKSEIKNK